MLRCRALPVLVCAAALAGVTAGALRGAPPAEAGILSTLGGAGCKLVGTVGEGWIGTACNGALSIGQKLTGGGKKAAKVIGKIAGNPLLQRGVGIAAIVAWVLGGAKWTLDHMAGVISQSTSPSLTAAWFTGVYLRVQGLALFFTLLFVFAAAAEALLRSEPALLARAVLAYLPLAAIATAVATPLAMLLLAATDQLSAGLAALAGQDTSRFLTGTSAWVAAGLTAVDPFFAVIAGGVVVAAGGALWVEMLIREVAVYVVVAMLPLVFAAIVWPARRVWAVRTVEVLVALILSKVAIVAVLALGGAALAHSGAGGLSRLLGGLALVVIGAFSPWVVLRLIPLAEVAAAAVGHVRGHLHQTAGVSTPEAALTRTAIGRVAGQRDNGHAGRNGDSTTVAAGLAVQELLEQMQRRAQAAEPPAAGADATAPSRAGSGDRSRSAKQGERPVPPPPASGGERGATAAAAAAEPETMVQRPDGSWEPLAHADPNAPIPPPPWEQPEHDAPAETDAGPRPAGPVAPEPQDGRLGGGRERGD
jgi:type IV secretion system protein TrbL